MNPSCNLFIVGPTGAGKTSIGRRLAAHYELEFLDLDQEIERHCGATVSTVFELEGEAGFRRRESTLLDACTARSGVLLATGAGAVLDPDNRRLLAGEDRSAKLQAMAGIRTPLYADVADLVIPGEHELVQAASERSIALIDQHWQRQQAA